MSDLTIKQGDTVRQTLTVRRNGVAVDLTGVELTFHLRNLRDDTDTLDEPLMPTDVDGGIAELHLTPEQTGALVAGLSYEYEVEQVDGTGDVWTPISGWVNVKRDRG